MSGNKRKKTIILSVMLILSMLSLCSCQTFDSFYHTFFEKGTKTKTDTIYIGVFESQTGKNSEKGNNQIKGIELAHKIYSNVNGQDIQLIKVDDQSKSSTARGVIKELIKMKPVAIIGSAGNATSLIASSYIGKASIPTITPSATNPLIAQNSGYYFMAGSTSSQQGAGLAEYAYSELKSERIGIVNIKNESLTESYVKSFRNKMKDLEGKKRSEKIVAEAEISITDTKMGKVVKSIQASNVDTVFLPLQTAQADAFFKAVEKLGMTDVTFLGTEDWGKKDFVKMMKKHPDIRTAFPYNSLDIDNASSEASVTREARRFQIEYERMYGDDDIPTQDTALGYDSYLLVINAISRSKSLLGADIRNSLISLSGIHCSTGVFEFDANGTTVKSVNIATIDRKKIVPVYTTKSAEKAETIKEIQ